MENQVELKHVVGRHDNVSLRKEIEHLCTLWGVSGVALCPTYCTADRGSNIKLALQTSEVLEAVPCF